MQKKAMQQHHQSQQLLLVACEESKQWRNELNTQVHEAMEEVTKRGIKWPDRE